MLKIELAAVLKPCPDVVTFHVLKLGMLNGEMLFFKVFLFKIIFFFIF
jgi:hypothetical protein